MSLETKNTVKGDLSRVDINTWDKASYWLPENVQKRKEMAIKVKEEALIKQAEEAGWTDIHGGDHGAYWRGVNPETKRCEKIPFVGRVITTEELDKIIEKVRKLHTP